MSRINILLGVSFLLCWMLWTKHSIVSGEVETKEEPNGDYYSSESRYMWGLKLPKFYNITHIMVGERNNRDRVLSRMRVVRDKSPNNKTVISNDISYPSKGVLNKINISYVEVLDKMQDGHGGTAEILKGGPGSKSIKINLKSQPGYGFDFLVTIWGAYKPADYANDMYDVVRS